MRRSGRNPSMTVKSRRLVAEPLETRRLLAGDVGTTSIDAGLLSIQGDGDPTNYDDTIVVRHSDSNAAMLEVVVNGSIATTRSVVGLRRIEIFGGRGDDTIRIDASGLRIGATINGGPGNDTISGGPRGDRIAGGLGDDTIDGGEGNDEIFGGWGDDYLRGGRGADRIVGGDGDDAIDGGIGHDTLIGGLDDDTIDGEAGFDTVRGDAGDDTLLGGTGRDKLFAGLGADRLFGITGRDEFFSDSSDTVTQSDLANPLVLATTESEIRRWLGGHATRQQHEAVFGGMAFGAARVGVSGDGVVSTPVASAPAPGGGPAAGTASGDFSSTNNQVAGVDEADLVRTDGRYLYMVTGSELVVIDTDPASLSVVSRTPIAGHGQTLYLHGDRLTVISQVSEWPDTFVPLPIVVDSEVATLVDGSTQDAPIAMSAPVAGDFASIPRCVMPWLPLEQHVRVTVIDVSAPAAPVVVEETRLDGTLSASRSIGEKVYLVVQNRPQIGPMPQLPLVWVGDWDANYEFESPEEFRERIQSADLDAVLPVARFTVDGEEFTQPLVSPGSIYLPVRGGDTELVSIVSLTPTDETPGIDQSVSTLGLAGTVYASPDSFILASVDYGTWWGSSEGATTLHQFSLAGDMPHVAAGTVPGRVLDQFAIDAHADGTVRIVTQTGWGPDASTNLFVLEAADGVLGTIGSVGDIAPGEMAMSARFVGDTAYVVTFEQVDPLFVIDLADPTQPTIVGELVIPGFSSYLHPVDGTHLIGIGRSADLSGVKLSLFDVSVPSQPTETNFVEIAAGRGNGYAWSVAEHDHHAFSYFAGRGILAIPVSSWEWDPSAETASAWNALVLYELDLTEGFNEVARIQHGSNVIRSLRIAGRLFSISENELKVVDLEDPGSVVASLPLA